MSLLSWISGKARVGCSETYFDDWSSQFLTNAFCQGNGEWFIEPGMHDLCPDFPSYGPLFRNVCARMPDRWWLQSVTHASGDIHDASFGTSTGGSYYLSFSRLGDGFRFCLPHTLQAERQVVGEFLRDLHSVLKTTDGLESLEWFSDSIFADGCAAASDLIGSGAPTPFDGCAAEWAKS